MNTLEDDFGEAYGGHHLGLGILWLIKGCSGQSQVSAVFRVEESVFQGEPRGSVAKLSVCWGEHRSGEMMADWTRNDVGIKGGVLVG